MSNPTQTMYELYFQLLLNSGLFEEDAKVVMQRAQDSEVLQAMKGRWQDKASDYPTAMLPIVLMGVSAETVKWMDEECPQHWARPMFDLKERRKLEGKVDELEKASSGDRQAETQAPR